jgi:GST-like protein
MTHKAQGFTLDDWPSVKRWYATLRARPMLQVGLQVGKDADKEPIALDAAARHNLFGGAASTAVR